MPSHKLACPEGVLHARISDVHHVVTVDTIRHLFHRSGDGYVICAFEQVVDGMYGVEVYVEFGSRWKAARARDALDGHAIYDGCCILAVDLVPPIYSTITRPDHDELAPAYFYDDTPYAEWAAALAVAERHDMAPRPSDELQIMSEIKESTTSPRGDTSAAAVTAPTAPAPTAMHDDDLTAATSIPVVVATSAVAVLAPNGAAQFVREDDLHLKVSTDAIGAPLSAALREPDTVVETHTMCSTICLGSDTGAVAAAMMAFRVLGEASVTTNCMVCDSCMDPVAHPAMSAKLDKPKGADTAVMHEDEQLLVAANDMAEDHIMGAGTSVMPLTPVALGVDGGHVTNTFEVLLQLQPLALFAGSKELYGSPLLPQFTQAMVAWGSCVNQLHPICSGLCFGLGCGTTYSVCLLPWDPGEKPVVLTDSIRSKDIDWGACVKQLDADGQVICSIPWPSLRYYSEVANPCSVIQGDCLQYEHLQQWRPPDRIISLACVVLNLLQASVTNLLREHIQCVCSSLSTFDQEGLHYRIGTVGIQLQLGCVVGTACLPFPTGYLLHHMGDSLSRALLLESHHQSGLEELHSPCDFTKAQVACSFAQNYMRKIIVVLYITHNAMDMIIGWESSSMACSTWMKENVPTQLLEHRVACTPTYLAVYAEQVAIDDGLLGYCGHVRRIFQPSYLEASKNLSSAAESVPCHCAPVAVGVVFPLGYVSLWKFAWFNLFDILRTIQNTSEFWSCTLWARTAVSLLFTSGNSTLKGPMEQWDPGIPRIFHICTQSCQVSCRLIYYAVTTEVNNLLQDWSQLYTMEYALRHGHAHIQTANSVMDIISPSLLEYSLQYCTAGHVLLGGSASFSISVVLLSEELQLSWDPGGPKFFGFFTQVGSKGRMNAAAPTYYCGHCLDHAYYFTDVRADQDYYLGVFYHQVHIGHDYYLDAFFEQVGVVCYLNLVKFYLDYDTHSDLGVVMKPQVPWDPGGSTWHRLEVKPNFKEGGMLATNRPSPGLGLALLGLGCTGWIDYIYRGNAYEQVGLERMASASSASVSSSSSSSAPCNGLNLQIHGL